MPVQLRIKETQVNTPGSGFLVGDYLTPVGSSAAPTIKVTSINGAGGVTGVDAPYSAGLVTGPVPSNAANMVPYRMRQGSIGYHSSRTAAAYTKYGTGTKRAQYIGEAFLGISNDSSVYIASQRETPLSDLNRTDLDGLFDDAFGFFPQYDPDAVNLVIFRNSGTAATVEQIIPTVTFADVNGAGTSIIGLNTDGVYEYTYSGGTWTNTATLRGAFTSQVPLAVKCAKGSGVNIAVVAYAPGPSGAGTITYQVFKKTSGTWAQVGLVVGGTTAYNHFDISSDGTKLVYINSDRDVNLASGATYTTITQPWPWNNALTVAISGNGLRVYVGCQVWNAAQTSTSFGIQVLSFASNTWSEVKVVENCSHNALAANTDGSVITFTRTTFTNPGFVNSLHCLVSETTVYNSSFVVTDSSKVAQPRNTSTTNPGFVVNNAYADDTASYSQCATETVWEIGSVGPKYAGRYCLSGTVSFSGGSPTVNCPSRTVYGYAPFYQFGTTLIPAGEGGSGYTNSNDVTVVMSDIVPKFP